jgi:hypothetical protein
METDTHHQPRPAHRIMISSTFTDLKRHRAALISGIKQLDFHAEAMENFSARLVDVIEASLKMVRDSAAYIGLIGLKYGQTPKSLEGNPDGLSITELEFNEAMRLGRPILLFIMDEAHPVRKSDIEKIKKKEKQLNAFRERAKRISTDSEVQRVYAVFKSLEDFTKKIGPSLVELCRHLDSNDRHALETTTSSANSDLHSIPKPPELYAEPRYIGSHKFVGREAQLQELNDWAKPADPTNLLLFQAIGGNGKSMLTWEWVTNAKYALAARPADSPWAGRFWYSFYETGAIMADFCQRALAYMTGRPLEEFAKKKTTALAKDLLALLQSRPWLVVLDGLERVLVAYHRIDAAEIPDEQANDPTDRIVNRNPYDAIRDEDNDLLRALAAVKPSKILVSSRLTPRVLLNHADQIIPGARRIELPGLRPADAEALLRSCGKEKETDPGIRGDSAAIQAYLSENCDNHPLVIGVLGGLINNYLDDRGNFDAWVTDPDGGASLDLGSLDLIQRRNHILRAALEHLLPPSRQLLSTLALLSDSVDYEVLKAFNPHLPPEPKEVARPKAPEKYWRWDKLSEEEKAKRLAQYEADMGRWREYEKAVKERLASSEYRLAPKKLEQTVRDLEQRGLLQWDGRDQTYDLHPVVRGVAAGGMQAAEKERYGRRVVDHFSSLPHNPYEQAETLEHLRPGLKVVRTLLKLGHLQDAADAYKGDLSYAILFNVEAYAEVLSLLREFFPNGWGDLPQGVDSSSAAYLANEAGICLRYCGDQNDTLLAYQTSLRLHLGSENWTETNSTLLNIAYGLSDQNMLAKWQRVNDLALRLSEVCQNQKAVFLSRLSLMEYQARIGAWTDAAATWQLLNPMGRDWSRAIYRPGTAEGAYADFHFRQGCLREEHIATAERLALDGKDRGQIRYLKLLRGAWRLEQGDWASAATSFAEAVRMARESGIPNAGSETGLALAKVHLGELTEPRREAERLTGMRYVSCRYLAMLWQAIGDDDQAKKHALAAYEWAWADGEPYVNRYDLTKSADCCISSASQSRTFHPTTLPRMNPSPGKPTSKQSSRN